MRSYCSIGRAAIILAVALGTGLALADAAKDTMALNNGDVLSGTLKEFGDGAAVFHTALAGMVIVPAEEVRAITTAEPRRVYLVNGEELTGRILTEGNAVYVASPTGRVALDLADVADIMPAPEGGAFDEAVEAGAPSAGRNTFELELGALWRSGVRDYSEPFAAFMWRYEGERWDFESRARVALSGGGDFPLYFLSQSEWRRELDDRYYGLFAVDMERDRREGLEWRFDLGAGAGRRLWETNAQHLDADTGLTLTADYFDLGGMERGVRREALDGGLGGWRSAAYYRSAGRTHHETEAAWRVRLQYTRDVFLDGEFTEDLVFYPSLTDWGQLRARSESVIRFPLSTNLNLRFDVLFDYQRHRAFPGLDPWRATVGAGIVWDF